MKQQKSQSGFAHIMIVVIILSLAVIGLLGFVFWQNFMQPKTMGADALNPSDVTRKDLKVIKTNADPLAGWKTYTNTTHSFSFKYPSDWSVTESPVEKSNNVATPTPTVEAINPNGDDIRIFVYKVDIGGWGFEGNYGVINYTAKLEAKKIALSGRNYGAATTDTESLGYLISFSFENSGYNYIFNATGGDVSRMDAADVTFNQIVSTWEFN